MNGREVPGQVEGRVARVRPQVDVGATSADQKLNQIQVLCFNRPVENTFTAFPFLFLSQSETEISYMFAKSDNNLMNVEVNYLCVDIGPALHQCFEYVLVLVVSGQMHTCFA